MIRGGEKELGEVGRKERADRQDREKQDIAEGSVLAELELIRQQKLYPVRFCAVSSSNVYV